MSEKKKKNISEQDTILDLSEDESVTWSNAIWQPINCLSPKDGLVERQTGSTDIPSFRYINCLESADLLAFVGTTADLYDNALAETVNGLYKTDVIEYLKSDWNGLADVEFATLDWVDWFSRKRLHNQLVVVF